MQKILIVEDDEKLRKEFEIFLNNKYKRYMFDAMYDNYFIIFINCAKKFNAKRYGKMTPVDINLYKTAILKDSEEIINDSKKPISFTLKDNGFDINLLKNIVETPIYEISNLTLEKTINLNIKNAKMASFKFQ